MMNRTVYDSARWETAREEVLERDGSCTYARLLGDECDGPLHVHHLNPSQFDPYDPNGLVVVCEKHHPKLEAVRRSLLRVRRWRRCPHRPGTHRYQGAREACERKLNLQV